MIKKIWQKNNLKDHFTTASLATAAYAPFFIMAQYDPHQADPYVIAGLGLGVFSLMRYEPFRNFLQGHAKEKFFHKVFGAVTPASEAVQNIVNSLADKMSLPRLEACVCETTNAAVHGGKVYIGKNFLEHLQENEVWAILAHEMAHYEGKHISEQALFALPGVSATVGILSGIAYAAYGMISGDSGSVGLTVGMAALNCVNYMYQELIALGRLRLSEYRADARGVEITEDVKSAQDSLCITEIIDLGLGANIVNQFKTAIRSGKAQISVDYKKPVWQKWTSSHPCLEDRLKHLDSIAMKMNMRTPAL